MKRILLILTALTLGTMFLSSCNSTGEHYSPAMLIGQLTTTRFIADDGTVGNIIKADLPAKNLNRAIAIVEIIDKISETEYNIRLRNYAEIKVKAITEKLDYTDDEYESLGTDPTFLYDGFLSGGYVNLQLGYFTTTGTNAKEHSFTLVFDSMKSQSDTLYFEIKHNADGETLDMSKFTSVQQLSTMMNSQNLKSTADYFSFNFKKVLGQEDSAIKTHPIKISAKWLDWDYKSEIISSAKLVDSYIVIKPSTSTAAPKITNL